MKILSERRKYLRAYIGYLTALKACYHILQKSSRKANNDITTNRLYSANVQIYNQA